MQSQVSELSPVRVQVKVQVPWDQVQKGLESEYSKLARSAKVRGFRPGRVPKHVVKRLFGPQVKSQVAEQLIEKGLMAAVTEHQLPIVQAPEVQSTGDLVDGQPYEFTAEIEVRPTIDKVVVDGLTITVPPATVDEAAVEAELERLRETHADLREPDPMRPAQAGDQLTIAYTLRLDDEEQDEFSAEERDVVLGDDDLLEAFNEGLTGAQPGDERDIEITFPDDHPNERLRGKRGHFKVQIKALKERLKPELDDEFAQDCGDFETLEDLRKAIREQLQETADRRREALLKERLIDKLLELNDVPVPPSLVQQQKQELLYEMMSFARMMGQNLSPGDLEGLDARAERRVKAGLLLSALARIEGIEVGDEAVEAKFQEMAEKTGKHIAKVRAEYAGERRDSLESSLLEEQLMGWLRSKATIEEREDEPAASEATPAASEEE